HGGERAGRAAGRSRLRLGAELVDERDHDVVRARAAGGVREGVLRREGLQGFDRRIAFDVPVEVAGAGEGRRDDAPRRALGERAHHAGDADAGADVGAAGNDRLHRLASASRAEIVEHDAMLLEDADVLTERGRLVLPVVDLADRDLERILGAGLQRQQRGRPRRVGNAFHRVFLLRARPLAALARRAGRRADALRTAPAVPARGGIPPRLASRVAQYSQVRSGTLGILLIAPAISISPGVSGPTLPIFLPSVR